MTQQIKAIRNYTLYLRYDVMPLINVSKDSGIMYFLLFVSRNPLNVLFNSDVI